MLDRMIVIIIAVVLDLVLGDPHFLWHPVVGIGKIIEYSERALRKIFKLSEEKEADKIKKRVAGFILAIWVIALTLVCCGLILYIAGRFGRVWQIAAEAVMCYQLLAMKSLKDESMKVYDALCTGDMEASRHAVSMIVGRNTEKLDDRGVTKAAVETVAENTSDGVVAPLIYMLIFGAMGGFFYKAVNTMDSMIGYKNDKYIYFGTAAARLDDVVNYIPARISAVLMIFAAYLLPGMDGKNAKRIFIRDRYKHSSPNSAQTEAVCAGALQIMLAGDAYYFGKLYNKPTIGDDIRPVQHEDIKQANNLMYMTSLLTFLIGELILLILYVL